MIATKRPVGLFGHRHLGMAIAQSMITGAREVNTVLKESSDNGGPGSIQSALSTYLATHKMGIRELAERSGIRRHRLQKICQGAEPTTDETNAISTVIDDEEKGTRYDGST